MQATVDQMCWVPIGDILENQESLRESTEDIVLLASRGDGRYTLLAGQERLNLLKEQGRCFVDAVISPSDALETRLSRLTSQLMKGQLHYLDEAAAYRSFVRGDGLSTKEIFAAFDALKPDAPKRPQTEQAQAALLVARRGQQAAWPGEGRVRAMRLRPAQFRRDYRTPLAVRFAQRRLCGTLA